MKARKGNYIEVVNTDDNDHIRPVEGQTGFITSVNKDGVDNETCYVPEPVFNVNLDNGKNRRLIRSQFKVLVS